MLSQIEKSRAEITKRDTRDGVHLISKSCARDVAHIKPSGGLIQHSA